MTPIVNGLNAYYGAPGMYAMSSYQATDSGGVNDGDGPNALVYNTTTVQLLASVPVDPPGGTGKLGSASGEYREVMRYELAPAGVVTNSANVFYIYVSHYKAKTGSANQAAREGEAQIIRTNETGLPASARVLYVGDYNVSTSGEASYQTIISNAAPNGIVQGGGIDPMNLSGSANVDWTQNSLLSLKSETATDLYWRFDFQIMTTNVYYGAPGGLAYVFGTYHIFGNNGTTPYEGSVNSGSNTALTDLVSSVSYPYSYITAANLYSFLTTASDHLPMVADYTIPIPAAAPIPNLQLANFLVSSPGGFQFAVSNADGTPVTLAEQSQIAVYATTNLTLVFTNWTLLTNSSYLTNGSLQINDTNSPLYSQRFYRALGTQ